MRERVYFIVKSMILLSELNGLRILETKLVQVQSPKVPQTYYLSASNVVVVYFYLTYSVAFIKKRNNLFQMWSIDYVQVPIDDAMAFAANSRPETPKRSETGKPLAIHNRLVKQINISVDSVGTLVKSGSESSLSEEGNLKGGGGERQAPSEISPKEWRSKLQNEKDTCSDNEEAVVVTPPVPPARRRSRVHSGIRKSEGNLFTCTWLQ